MIKNKVEIFEISVLQFCFSILLLLAKLALFDLTGAYCPYIMTNIIRKAKKRLEWERMEKNKKEKHSRRFTLVFSSFVTFSIPVRTSSNFENFSSQPREKWRKGVCWSNKGNNTEKLLKEKTKYTKTDKQ